MVTWFDWFALVVILLVAAAGGYKPLTGGKEVESPDSFALGQAFSAGVFLALSLLIMLPNGQHLWSLAFPGAHYPLAPTLSLVAFLLLVALGHVAYSKRPKGGLGSGLTSPTIPIIMTVMIAIPSFLLGTALGVSDEGMAIMIFVAVLIHKGSAGFALALAMARSSLTKRQSWLLFGMFACSTPLGILLGADLHVYLKTQAALYVKACTLSLASGVFLYMGCLHEMRHPPLVVQCCTVRGFAAMVVGLAITGFVRLILGLAHSAHH